MKCSTYKDSYAVLNSSIENSHQLCNLIRISLVGWVPEFLDVTYPCCLNLMHILYIMMSLNQIWINILLLPVNDWKPALFEHILPCVLTSFWQVAILHWEWSGFPVDCIITIGCVLSHGKCGQTGLCDFLSHDACQSQLLTHFTICFIDCNPNFAKVILNITFVFSLLSLLFQPTYNDEILHYIILLLGFVFNVIDNSYEFAYGFKMLSKQNKTKSCLMTLWRLMREVFRFSVNKHFDTQNLKSIKCNHCKWFEL